MFQIFYNFKVNEEKNIVSGNNQRNMELIAGIKKC